MLDENGNRIDKILLDTLWSKAKDIGDWMPEKLRERYNIPKRFCIPINKEVQP